MAFNGLQLRAARAALQWSIADLAKKAKVGISTVQAIEADNPAGAEGLEATKSYRKTERQLVTERIAVTLEAAGVTLLPDDGHGAGIRYRPARKAR